jgi:ZIP family zinc transporter
MAIALLPVAGNLLGALLAELTRPPREVVGIALHAAAGVAVALVAVELMPGILDTSPPLAIVGAFLLGAAFTIGLARGASSLCRLTGGGSASAWMIYIAVAADLFSDGLMTGAGGAVSSSLGLLLGLSQVVANVPGGFAATANFRRVGVPRPRRLAFAAAAPLPVLVAAAGGFLLLRGRPEVIQDAAIGFIVGLLLLATAEDTLPQGDAPHPRRVLSTAGFAGGFAMFALLAATF